MNLNDIINKRILVLDGAMGTMIQKENLNEEDFRGSHFKEHNVPLKGLNDLLVITQPDIIKNIHSQYLDAGADIITTNTFNANYYSLKDYKLHSIVHDINYQAVKIAKDVTFLYNQNDDKPRFVAGTIGPTAKTASISPDIENPEYRDVSFDELVEVYYCQAKAMVKAGVDILLVETVFDTLNAKAALYAINRILKGSDREIPVMVSATIDESGRNLSGQTVEAFYNSMLPFSLFSIGLNCSFGADKMLPYLERLSVKANINVTAHPNAGFPNEMGEYDQKPAEMAEMIEVFCKNGLVNIVGGCCGSKPEHINEIAEISKKYSPRRIVKNPQTMRLSGLQSLGIKNKTGLIKISEKTNVNGSKKFADLIKNKNFADALEIARNQIQEGAYMINVNLDDSLIDAKKNMQIFLNYIAAEPDIANVPVMIDSSDFEVIRSGLKCLQGRSVVNYISLKDGEESFKQKAREIKELGAAVMVMAFDEKGQADTFERKIEICKRAYNILTNEIKFDPEDIIFDTNVLTIGTGIEKHNSYAVDFINSVKWIKNNLPHAKVNAGVSNISFAFRGNEYLRNIINSVFLHYCEKQGLDFAIVDPSKIIEYEKIPKEYRRPVEDLILNRRRDATEKVIDLSNKSAKHTKKDIQLEEWRTSSSREKIVYALCNGKSKYLEKDIMEYKKENKCDSIDIIQGPLMEGMDEVGKLFSSGKMFLPQVIKSARIMNKAVKILMPDIEKESKELKSNIKKNKTKVLLATVEGDVHDIGKNIVSLILRCNNYEVIDLGVMVSNKKIVDIVEKEKPDIIGLSGLISPSLDKMLEVVKRLENKKIKIPVLVGGAATSELHTAVKIAPHYSGVVVHSIDAMSGITITNKLMEDDCENTVLNIKNKQEKLRKEYSLKRRGIKFLSIEEARKRRYKYKKSKTVKPKLLGTKMFDRFEIKELENYIDWTPFFNGWGLKGKYPEIFEKERVGSEAERLFKEAHEMLEEIKVSKIIKPKGIIGIFPANSKDDDVLIFKNDNRKDVIAKIPMLRQQYVKDNSGYSLSLADFIAPFDSGMKDYLGGFAATAGIGIDDHLSYYKENGDSYKSIMFRLITDRLVEATAEIMHEKVRKKYWGYDPKENLSPEEVIKGKFKGIRPAVGYPSCPDHSLKKHLFDLMDVEHKIGISLTDIYAMKPASSVSGFYFANDASKYFGVGKIGKDQVNDYAKRIGEDLEKAEKWLYFAMDDK